MNQGPGLQIMLDHFWSHDRGKKPSQNVNTELNCAASNDVCNSLTK